MGGSTSGHAKCPSDRPDCQTTTAGRYKDAVFVRRYDLEPEHPGNATTIRTGADPDFVLPRVLYLTPTPRHTLENTGSDDLVVIGVELTDHA